jgi:hypothetical protein
MFLKIRKQSDEKHYSSWLDNKYTFPEIVEGRGSFAKIQKQ